jgi:hypothetical protein
LLGVVDVDLLDVRKARQWAFVRQRTISTPGARESVRRVGSRASSDWMRTRARLTIGRRRAIATSRTVIARRELAGLAPAVFAHWQSQLPISLLDEGEEVGVPRL